MVHRAIKISLLALLATSSSTNLVAQPLPVGSALPTVLLQQADQAPAPKLEKVTLININFGSNPSIVVKNAAGEQRSIVVFSNVNIRNDKTAGTLTKMAQTELNKLVHIQTERVNGVNSVTRMWDAESYADWVNGHNGSRNGQVKGLFPKALVLGDHVYTINDNTRFVLEGKNVGRKKLEGREVLWVKCVVKNGVAIADVIADTSTSLGVTPSGNNSRPPSGGRPASVGNPNGTGNRGESGISPTERGNRERPASQGGSTKSPTERSKANTRSMTLEERARQDQVGWKVKVTLEILDANDNPTSGEKLEPVTDVMGAAAGAAGVGDQKVELYANLGISGSNSVDWKREDAEDRKHQKGDKIVLKQNGQDFRLIKQYKLTLQGYVRDRDQLSKDDDLIEVNQSFVLYDLWVAQRTVIKPRNAKVQIIVEVEK